MTTTLQLEALQRMIEARSASRAIHHNGYRPGPEDDAVIAAWDELAERMEDGEVYTLDTMLTEILDGRSDLPRFVALCCAALVLGVV